MKGIICANCCSSQILKLKTHYECCKCHHIMIKNKNKKLLIAAQASTHVAKHRKPSLPKLKFMEK